jgi:hypothetical protein
MLFLVRLQGGIMPEKIKASDFLKAETVKFIEKIITAFCSRKGLLYAPLEPDYNLLFAIGIERCNYEYPGKGEGTHFHSGIRSYLEVHDEHLFLLLRPDNRASEAVKDVILDLTAIQKLQECVVEKYLIWLIENAITVAMQSDEEGLEKFRRPLFRLADQ